MFLANTNLVPSYDMLGLPAPAWVIQLLMALTLALHWSFLAMTAGGVVALIFSWNRGSDTSVTKMRTSLGVFLPFSLGMAMTLGIAPLLFVQTLYGNLFYAANIMMAYVWLGLLVFMIVNLYLLFLGWSRLKRGLSVRPTSIVVLILMAASALILSAMATLTQNPQDWDQFRACGGGVPYLADATFLPRWLLALCALLAGGSLFAAIYERSYLSAGKEEKPQRISKLLLVSGLAVIGILLCGFWGSRVLPQQTRDALFGGGESVFAYAALVLFHVTMVVAFAAGRRASPGKMIVAAVAFFLALFSTAALRDTLRRIALADYHSPSNMTVHAQWSSFVLFAVIFVLGLGVVAYVVSIAYRQKLSAAG